MSAVAHRPEVSDALKLKLQVVVSCQVWMLGTKRKSSGEQ